MVADSTEKLPSGLCVAFTARYLSAVGKFTVHKNVHCVHVASTMVIKSQTYELCGAIMHKGAATRHGGESTLAGHYTALSRRNGVWYMCDDAIVTPINDVKRDVLNTIWFRRAVYVLCYEVAGAFEDGTAQDGHHCNSLINGRGKAFR